MRWAAVGEAPGYEVSTHGRVRSYRRRFSDALSGTPVMLKNGLTRDGYPKVCLQVNGKVKNFTIHRLMGLAFLGPPPADDSEVRHRDGVRTNCVIGNLLWGTRLENIADKIAHGNSGRGTTNALAKLSESAVIEIRSSSLTNTELSKIHRVTRTVIRRVRQGRSYLNVEGPSRRMP